MSFGPKILQSGAVKGLSHDSTHTHTHTKGGGGGGGLSKHHGRIVDAIVCECVLALTYVLNEVHYHINYSVCVCVCVCEREID